MPKKTSLRTGEQLRIGEVIFSASSKYFLVVQPDGNLCVVKGQPDNRQGSVWCIRNQPEPTGDYFAVMQGDGNLCVYRDNGPQPPVWSWHTGPISGAGTNFAAVVEDNGNLTINEVRSGGELQPRWSARRNLRLLTFNLHLMEDSNLEAGAALTGDKPVIFQDTTRRAHIIAKIIDSGAHIVALQEVWAAKWMDYFVDTLRSVYPYSYRGSKGAPARGGSGIILLSKYGMSNEKFFEFRGASGLEETMGTKGAISATIELPDGVKIRVGCTHAWTNAGGSECTNMKDLLGWTVTGRSSEEQAWPAVMMGDFNIHRYGDPGQFGKLTDIMRSGKAFDSWNIVNPTAPAKDAYTDDSRENTLAEFFCPNRDTAGGDCIDFVYLRNGDSTAVRPVSARVPRDWSYNSGDIQPYWYWVHHGTVTGLPSIAQFADGRLCVATRTAGYKDEPDGALQLSMYDPADKTWKHRTRLENGQHIICDGSPSIVAMGLGVLVFYRKGGNVFVAESDGERCGNARYLDWVKTSGGLCAVVHRGLLYLFVRDVNGRGVYCHKSSSLSPMDLDRGTALQMTTSDDIAAASLDRVLCVITKDGKTSTTGGVMRATMGGDGTWSQGYQIGKDVVTSGSPGIMAANGRFGVFFREPDGGGILHSSSPDGIAWQAEPFTGHATTDGVTPVHYGGKTMLFYPFIKNQGDGNMYHPRALAHGYVPPGVKLDLSDHYPYIVDVVY